MRKTTFVNPLSCCIDLVCLAALGMACLPAFAQGAAAPNGAAPAAVTMPTDPKALMLLAAKTNGLTGPDVQPWHLKASFKLLDEKGNISDQGTYEEVWASPTKYKRAFISTAFTQTEYGTDRGILQTGMRQQPPNLIADLRRELVNPLAGPLSNPLFIALQTYELRRREIDGEELACLTIAGVAPDPGLSYCLALDRPFLRSTSSSDEALQVLHRSPVLVQGRFVPGDLRFMRAGKAALIAHLEGIETLSAIREIDYAPSPGAVLLPRRVSISAGVAVGMIQSNTVPIYPPEAKAAGIWGTVLLRAVIGVKGRVSEVQVVSGPPELQQAAMDAVRSWQYRPYLLNGEPVEVNTQINVVFTLSK